MQTQTTRRALIGGAGLASIALLAPSIAAVAPAADRSAWASAIAMRDRAHAAWSVKLDDFDQAQRAYFADRTEEHSAEYDRAEKESERLCGLDDDARRALDLTPAPDLAAAIYKLEQANEWGLPITNALADIRRLAKLEG